jgi:hypothetical protein
LWGTGGALGRKVREKYAKEFKLLFIRRLEFCLGFLLTIVHATLSFVALGSRVFQ